MTAGRRCNGKILGIIPARMHSTRLPGKPLADIAGKPMIQWVYERASKARSIDRLVVATDDDRILDAVRAFGGQAMMTSSSHRSGTDRLVEVVERTPGYDVVMNIQGDEPLVDPANLELLAERFLADSQAPMGTLARPPADEAELLSSATAKVVRSASGLALYFSRAPIPYNRDDLEQVDYLVHIGIYIYERDFLLAFAALGQSRLERAERLEQLRALEHGYPISVFEVQSSSFGIDTPEDLERIRRLMAN